MFNSLNKDMTHKIIEKFLNQLKARLNSKEITFNYDDKAVSYLDKYFDQTYGARPLKRAIQNEVEDQIAYDILSDKITKSVNVSAKDNHLTFLEK